MESNFHSCVIFLTVKKRNFEIVQKTVCRLFSLKSFFTHLTMITDKDFALILQNIAVSIQTARFELLKDI